jgi:hypothetical protein
MYELSRGVSALLGAAVGGFLVWLATQVNVDATGGYWARYGLIAGAGLVLALALAVGSTTRGVRPAFSPGRFLLAFLPVLIVVGWIAIANQPDGNWFRGHVLNWSGDLSIGGVVGDLGDVLAALSLAAGVVFGFCFDTVPVATTVTADRGGVAHDADEPLAAERRTVPDEPPAREPVAAPAATVDDGAATPSER